MCTRTHVDLNLGARANTETHVCCRVLPSRCLLGCGSCAAAARHRRRCRLRHCLRPRRAVGALHERSARRPVHNTLRVSISGVAPSGRVWSSVRTARAPTAAHEPPKHPEGLCRCGCVLSVAGLTSGLTSLRRAAAAQLQSQRYLDSTYLVRVVGAGGAVLGELDERRAHVLGQQLALRARLDHLQQESTQAGGRGGCGFCAISCAAPVD